MAPTVFIDGEAGTTGLMIRERLNARDDLTVLSIDPAKRKDASARKELLNEADAVILCLPDDAAREAVSLIDNDRTKVIDASTAHRVAEGWVYGFAEMAPEQREKIAASTRISNPGCYPTGFIGLVAPLVRAGVIPSNFPLTVNAISGYSGGGNGLIAEFEGEKKAPDTFRTYGMTLAHKHLPEMKTYTGIANPPLFAPSVGSYAKGMLVEVPVQAWALEGVAKSDRSAAGMRGILVKAYEGETFVKVADDTETAALQKARAGGAGHVVDLDPEALNGTNLLKLFVFGNDDSEQVRLIAILDNLGKGASGAAVQNLNLVLGLDETAGLL